MLGREPPPATPGGSAVKLGPTIQRKSRKMVSARNSMTAKIHNGKTNDAVWEAQNHTMNNENQRSQSGS